MAQGGDRAGAPAVWNGGLVRRTIEERALFTPDATAMIDRDGRAFTWHELNARANRLADQLCEKGANASTIVGLGGHACAAVVVGWLAAVKTDAAVVPLGESHDSETTRALEAAAPRLVLRASDAFDVPNGIPTVTITLDGPVPASPNIQTRSRPEQAALVAAGPDGLLRVTHRDLDELARWQSRALHPAGAVRVCTLSPATTLASLREIAATLGVGGTICFPPMASETSPALWGFLREAGISRLYIPGEQVDALAALSRDLDETLDRLRDLIVVGSLHLSPDLMSHFTRHPHARVHMMHHAHDSSAVGACTLALPFASSLARTAPARVAAPAQTVLCKIGGFAARLASPAVA